jgi:hypothetical protein
MGLRKVRKTGKRAQSAAVTPVQAPQKPAARGPAKAREPEVSGEAETDRRSLRRSSGITGSRRAPRIEAFRKIVDPWAAHGWGFRVVMIGASGSGKSYFTAQLIDYALATGANTSAFVYDHKDPVPQKVFEDRGIVRASVADLMQRPPEAGDAPIIVFHEDGPGDPDSVAQKARDMAPEEKVFVVVDELFPDAVTDNGRGFKSGQSGPIGTALRAGRSRGTSIAVGTQLPQNMPTLATSLCEAVVWFRQQGGALSYIESEKRLPPDALAVVPTLRTKHESEFLIVVEGTWDGQIYGPT